MELSQTDEDQEVEAGRGGQGDKHRAETAVDAATSPKECSPSHRNRNESVKWRRHSPAPPWGGRALQDPRWGGNGLHGAGHTPHPHGGRQGLTEAGTWQALALSQRNQTPAVSLEPPNCGWHPGESGALSSACSRGQTPGPRRKLDGIT